MSDTCRLYEDLTSRLLSVHERDLLEHHLLACDACRAARRASLALRDELAAMAPAVDPCAFDAAILRAVSQGRAASPAALQPAPVWALAARFAAGACAAACASVILLGASLHAAPRPQDLPWRADAPQPTAPPVSLRSLLDTRSPRAALLWTRPGAPPAARNVPHWRSGSRAAGTARHPAPAGRLDS